MSLARLHREILACKRCVDAGYLPQAAPVLSGYPDNRIMLIGQAPGAVEAVRRLPFQGRSRKVLMGWLIRAGFSSEAQVRRHVALILGKTAGPPDVLFPALRGAAADPDASVRTTALAALAHLADAAAPHDTRAPLPGGGSLPDLKTERVV